MVARGVVRAVNLEPLQSGRLVLMYFEIPIRKGYSRFLPYKAFDINVRKHLAPAEESSESLHDRMCLRANQPTPSDFILLMCKMIPHSVKYIYEVRILSYVQFIC